MRSIISYRYFDSKHAILHKLIDLTNLDVKLYKHDDELYILLSYVLFAFSSHF